MIGRTNITFSSGKKDNSINLNTIIIKPSQTAGVNVKFYVKSIDEPPHVLFSNNYDGADLINYESENVDGELVVTTIIDITDIDNSSSVFKYISIIGDAYSLCFTGTSQVDNIYINNKVLTEFEGSDNVASTLKSFEMFDNKVSNMQYAFTDCLKLTKVTILADSIENANGIFMGSYNITDCKIYNLRTSLALYNTAITEESFRFIVGSLGTPIQTGQFIDCTNNDFFYKADDIDISNAVLNGWTFIPPPYVPPIHLKEGSEINNILKAISSSTGSSVLTFEKSTVAPDESQNPVNIARNDMPLPAYIWLDGSAIKYYTEASFMYMSENSADMFSNCTNLSSLDLSGFDTSNVTNMSGMFSYMYNIPSLDLSEFDTSNVTNMSGMFSDCHATSINVSSFNTSKVKTMTSMFYNCQYLESIDLSNFDTSNVTNMDVMFGNCGKLLTANLSGFNTSNVTSMVMMFAGCYYLTLTGSFNMINVDSAYNMFNGVSFLFGEWLFNNLKTTFMLPNSNSASSSRLATMLNSLQTVSNNPTFGAGTSWQDLDSGPDQSIINAIDKGWDLYPPVVIMPPPPV